MYIKTFKQLSSSDVIIAGGKGASLGEMTKAGIPVPPGFVVLASTFDKFLEAVDLDVEIDAALNQVNHKEIHTVEGASEKIQALILEAKMPDDIAKDIKKYFKELDSKYVAVRSSATAEDSSAAAWAGQLESYLNTTEETLLQNVQKCWASLFTPRAIFYRFEKDLHKQKISVAVVIQKMVESEVSGIAFSVHPVTQDRNQLIIEAGFGLGEAIVSGSVTPDSYVAEKNPFKIIDININEQSRGLYRVEGGGNEWRDISPEKAKSQVLSEKEIEELSRLIIKIENHYGFPVDIEWAKEKGEFYIVQCRPITTLTVKKEDNKSLTVIDGVERVLAITRNMSFWHQYLSSIGHYVNTKDFGVEAVNEQVYITIDGTQTHMFLTPSNAKEYAEAILNAVSSLEKIKELEERYKVFVKELLEALESLKQNLTVDNLQTFFEKYTRMCAGLNLTAVLGRVGIDKLTEKLLKQGIVEENIPEIIGAITYPPEHTPLFDSQLDLLKIGARVQKEKMNDKDRNIALEEWLSKYGHIPVNFCDEPWSLNDAQMQLQAMLEKDCTEEVERLKNVHEEKTTNAQKQLKKINDEDITVLATALAQGTYLNEFRKGVFSKVSLGYRDIFQKIAHQGGSNNWRDCFFLTPNEMINLLEGRNISVAERVRERQVAGCKIQKNGTNMLLDKEEVSRLERYVKSLTGQASHSSESAKKEIKGFSANRGIVKAIAKIILSSKDFHKLLPGEILVTTMTSVDFVPVMERAGAFVTNEGGITSHASIVAREMNKPCVIGTKIATQIIRDGDLVEVDADKGIVRILSNQEGKKTLFNSSELIDLKPDEWHHYGLWKQNVFSACFWEACFERDTLEKFGILIPTAGTLIVSGGNFFYHKPTVDNVRMQVSEKILKGNTKFLEDFAKDSKHAYLEGISYAKEHAQFLEPTTESFKTFLRYAEKMSFYWWFSAVHLAIVTEQLLQDKVVETSFPTEHVPHLVPKVDTPLFEQQKEVALLRKEVGDRSLEDIKKDKKLLQKLEHCREKYAWIEVANWIGEEITLEGLFDQIKHAKEMELPADFTAPVSVALIAKCMGYVAYAKQGGAEYVSMYEYLMRPFLNKVANKIELTYRQMMTLTHDEVLAALAGDSSKNLSKTVQERTPMKWIIVSEGTKAVFIDDPHDVKVAEDQMIPHVIEGTKEVKGEIGNRGKAQGTVRIIMNVDDFHKLKPKDVLVTTMTTPDFVILMQKASAIVTDIGGLLCHAAIVSRELRKPCVIGTKFATQVLQDGDFVDVDADNGIVRIVSKS